MDDKARQGIIYSQDDWLDLDPAGTAVTAGYQYSGAVSICAFSQVVCYVHFELGAATGVNYKFQFSPNASDWYDEEGVRSIEGTGQLTTVEVYRTHAADDDRRIAFPVLDDWIRVGAQGIAGVNFLTTVFTVHLRVG